MIIIIITVVCGRSLSLTGKLDYVQNQSWSHELIIVYINPGPITALVVTFVIINDDTHGPFAATTVNKNNDDDDELVILLGPKTKKQNIYILMYVLQEELPVPWHIYSQPTIPLCKPNPPTTKASGDEASYSNNNTK